MLLSSRCLPLFQTALEFGQVGFDLLLGSIYSDFDLFWFRSAQDTNFKLPIIRSTRILICTVFDLHCFRSAIFGSAKISLCSVFDLHRFRSARISIYMYFDMQINFRSMDFSICKSNFDLQIFRSANQISIYRFFDLQIKFRSTDFSICKSNFDLKIFRSVLCTMIKYLQYSPKWTWNSQYHDILKFLDTIIPIICIDWHSRNLK